MKKEKQENTTQVHIRVYVFFFFNKEDSARAVVSLVLILAILYEAAQSAKKYKR